MTGGRGGPALAAGLRSLRSLRPAAKAGGKTPGGTGEARCLLPLKVCNFQLPKVRNFRLPLTGGDLMVRSSGLECGRGCLRRAEQ